MRQIALEGGCPIPFAKEMRMATSTVNGVMGGQPSLDPLSLSLSLSIYVCIYKHKPNHLCLLSNLCKHTMYSERERERESWCTMHTSTYTKDGDGHHLIVPEGWGWPPPPFKRWGWPPPPLTKATAMATFLSYQKYGDGHHPSLIYMYICMDTWRLA